MKNGMTTAVSWVSAAMILACGGAQKEPAQGGNAAADASSNVQPLAVDAGPPAPPERPFAKTPAEATSLIDEAVSARAAQLSKCVEETRVRRKDKHAKVTVEIGIDQEGTLLGVKTPKGQPDDKALAECVQAALTGAPFPRSHSGVITVKKTFEDTVVYK